MDYRRFGDTIILRVQKGEELIATIGQVAESENVHLASVDGLGACNHAAFGVFLAAEQRYVKMELDEEAEIVGLHGNISTMDGKLYQHYHAAFGTADGRLVGGHINEAMISATAEIFIRIIDGQVDRVKDKKLGLNLLDF